MRIRAVGMTPHLESLLEELESFANYDAEKGGFIIKRKRHHNAADIGDTLGGISGSGTKYRYTTIGKASEKISRLVWLWHNGTFPEKQLDHINGNTLDDRIENLRDVSISINMRNRRKSSNNTTGYTGVYFHARTGKWNARIEVDGKVVSLKYHKTPEDANEARLQFINNNPQFNFTSRHGV